MTCLFSTHHSLFSPLFSSFSFIFITILIFLFFWIWIQNPTSNIQPITSTIYHRASSIEHVFISTTLSSFQLPVQFCPLPLTNFSTIYVWMLTKEYCKMDRVSNSVMFYISMLRLLSNAHISYFMPWHDHFYYSS